MKKEDIIKLAKEIRCVTSEMFIKRGDGHLGGAFSIADALAVLFGNYIDHTENVKDWFVLSKGHAGPSYYATLAILGKIPPKHILTLNENGTLLPSHPDRNKTPGVDCTTGSLGQGISQAVGIAYGLKVQEKPGYVYCIIGDGECNEGEVYEALQFAAHKRLNNLILLLDVNQKQVDGFTKDVSCNFKFDVLMDSLGFHHVRINGNDVDDLDKAIQCCQQTKNMANIIIMDTIKGCGIPYFEAKENPHHVTFNEEDIKALKDYCKVIKEELKL